jgi:hypothetical protein
MKNNSIAFTIDASDYESPSDFLRTIRDTLKNEKNLKLYAMMVNPKLASEPNLKKMVTYGLSFNRDSVTIRLRFDNSTGNSDDQQIESY